MIIFEIANLTFFFSLNSLTLIQLHVYSFRICNRENASRFNQINQHPYCKYPLTVVNIHGL